MNSAISVKLEAFEGPLDLLLHLIEKNKVNIYDIPIVMITEQYMEYIQEMQEKDLDVMSEFMVMAATLINIKSKMLLPPEVNEDEEEIEDAEMEYFIGCVCPECGKFFSVKNPESYPDDQKFICPFCKKHVSIEPMNPEKVPCANPAPDPGDIPF